MQQSMIEVNKYSAENKEEWNAFIDKSKNATFILSRNYMDYQSHRFVDHSLIFKVENKVIALFPANQIENTIYSYQGLTYGGLLLSAENSLTEVIELFKTLIEYYRQLGISTIYYKCIPYFYHKFPSSEDLYALFLNNAQLIKREASAVIELKNRIGLAKGRKSQISKALKFNFTLIQSEEFTEFWDLVQKRLNEKYDAKPTHNAQEINQLAIRFPENIKLYLCKKDNDIHAGIIIFETNTAAHCQYISTSEYGRDAGALDLLTNYLLCEVYKNKMYFDFGTSTEMNELMINKGLYQNKESYGARTITCDTYVMNI